MNFTQSFQYLDRFLNYERILHLQQNRVWNLERMKRLLQHLGHPEKKIFPVIIAGTKGKGSTGYFLEQILLASGIRTGFYSSPHLESPTERIRLQGKMISSSAWTQSLMRIKQVLEKVRLPKSLGQITYFEILTLLAIQTFAEHKIEIGIFEVGLGGRLDATNAVRAPLAIITSISLDHEKILGNTVEKIATEKAGVIHARSEVITGAQPFSVMRVLQNKVRETQSQLWKAKPWTQSRLGLHGEFQKKNAGLAVCAANRLCQKWKWEISEKAIRQGLSQGNWPGRLESIGQNPPILLDGAHNPASMRELVHYLKQSAPHKHSLLIFGTSRDKNYQEMLRILSGYFKEMIVTQVPNSRACDVTDVIQAARPYFDIIFPAGSIPSAFQMVKKLAANYESIVATGSFYLIGEMRALCSNQVSSGSQHHG